MERPSNKSWPLNKGSDILRTMKNKSKAEKTLTKIAEIALYTKDAEAGLKKIKKLLAAK